MKSLSLIIPAHNTEKVIETSLIDYHKFLSRGFKDFEMIVVCNDCWDNTVRVVESLSKQLPIKTIEISQRGKGYALIKGFNESNLDIFGFLDADNPFDLLKVRNMINHLDSSDIVIASKYLKGSARLQNSLLRRFISFGGGIVSKTLFNLNFLDTQAGAKFFKREVWQTINNRNNFTCTGFDWDIEFLYKAIKNKFSISEIHVPFKPEKFSTFRLKYLPGMMKRLLKLRFLR